MAGEYQLVVQHVERLSPHLVRITLGGKDLTAFPEDQESGYVKLLLTGADGEQVVRSYTIRSFDPVALSIVLDFVDHGDSGPASAWASRATVGEAVTIRGPGEKKLVDPAADWVFLAGDLSALPALAVNLEKLSADSRGYAIVEVPSAEDILPLSAPAGVEVTWVVNPDEAAPNKELVAKLRQQPWLPGRAYPWFAGEFEGMRAARRYFRDERGISRREMYLSCYWKLGATDEGMKRAKRQDALAEADA